MNLYGIFKDGMVFQRDKAIKVFGTAKPNEKIDASLLKGSKKYRTGSTQADQDGNFLITMEPSEAAGPFTLRVGAYRARKTEIKDVYIGEVWFACGQENMLMPLKMTEDHNIARHIIKGNDRLHYYVVPDPTYPDFDPVQAEKDSEWIVVDTKSAQEMSAVSYYFALELMRRFDCHVGIIGCFAMGSSVTSWQSIESVRSTPEGRNYIKAWDRDAKELTEAEYRNEYDVYHLELRAWKKRYEAASKDHPTEAYDTLRKIVGNWPHPIPKGRGSMLRPGGLFESMVLKVMPYNVKGVIYYQGESDTLERCDEYGAVLKSLINEWRTLWDDQKLPFIFCQLHMYIDRDRRFMGYEDYKWPMLREQQHLVSKVTPNTYLAILSDCGEFDNMYPIDKLTPGLRLALLALKYVYGFREVSAVSPYMIDIRGTKGGAEMSFTGDFEMLLMKGFGDTGFEVSGTDGVFYPCDAAVDFDGKTVTVFSPYVLEPVTVRYAYFSYGQSSLSSDTGLAVMPFTKDISKNLEDE